MKIKDFADKGTYSLNYFLMKVLFSIVKYKFQSMFDWFNRKNN